MNEQLILIHEFNLKTHEPFLIRDIHDALDFRQIGKTTKNLENFINLLSNENEETGKKVYYLVSNQQQVNIIKEKLKESCKDNNVLQLALNRIINVSTFNSDTYRGNKMNHICFIVDDILYEDYFIIKQEFQRLVPSKIISLGTII